MDRYAYLDEERIHIVPAPTRVTQRNPVIVYACTSASIVQPVGGARSAPGLTTCIYVNYLGHIF